MSNSIEYRNEDGKRHRTDGPAIICPDGSESWWVNGQLHRTDGPAAIYPDGSESWWLNGDLHRIDGPAIMYPAGREEWWLVGIRYTFNEYVEKMNWSEDQIIEWKLTHANT